MDTKTRTVYMLSRLVITFLPRSKRLFLGGGKNDSMICVCFQGKPKVDAPATNAAEAEVEWVYEDLQDLLELTPQKMSFSSYGKGKGK